MSLPPPQHSPSWASRSPAPAGQASQARQGAELIFHTTSFKPSPKCLHYTKVSSPATFPPACPGYTGRSKGDSPGQDPARGRPTGAPTEQESHWWPKRRNRRRTGPKEGAAALRHLRQLRPRLPGRLYSAITASHTTVIISLHLSLLLIPE